MIQKEDLNDLSIDELEIIKSKEKEYIKSGDVLLEAMLNLPFKNREKVESLLKKISVHKSNITIIDTAILHLTNSQLVQNGIISGSIWIGQGHNGSNINLSGTNSYLWGGTSSIYINGGTSSINGYSSYSSIDYMLKKTNICYLDLNNCKVTVEVIDDIFHSVLGNYYLNTITGSIISLNRVIEIDEDSTLGKWYQKMCKNFEREVKLNRVLKDGNDE